MPKHTTEKAHLECTDCGSFWRYFCAPHSQPFAQTQRGGTKRKARAKHERSHQGNTPAFGFGACHLLAFVGLCCKNEGDEKRPWEFRTSGGQEKWTTAYFALEHPCDFPAVTNALEVPDTSHGFTPVCPCSGASSDNSTLPFGPLSLLPHLLHLGVYSPRSDRIGHHIP